MLINILIHLRTFRESRSYLFQLAIEALRAKVHGYLPLEYCYWTFFNDVINTLFWSTARRALGRWNTAPHALLVSTDYWMSPGHIQQEIVSRLLLLYRLSSRMQSKKHHQFSHHLGKVVPTFLP